MESTNVGRQRNAKNTLATSGRYILPKIIENVGGPTGYWSFNWIAVWRQPGSVLLVIVLLNHYVFLYHTL